MTNKIKNMWIVRTVVTDLNGDVCEMLIKANTRSEARLIKASMKEVHRGSCNIKITLHKMMEAVNTVNQVNLVYHKVVY